MTGTQLRLPAFDGRIRLGFVLFGGMVTLQSSSSLDASKLAYLAGTVLCVLGAATAVWQARRTPAVGRMAPWLAASGALAVIIAISFVVARFEGTSLVSWARDAAGYVLFAAVPILALDAQASTSRRLLLGMLVVAGLLGGTSWAVEWLGRRHIVDLAFGRIVFPTGQLPSLLYLIAMATAMIGGLRSRRWAALAGVVLGLFLMTGTRSSLLLLVGPVAMAATLSRSRIRAALPAVALHAVVAVGLVLAVQVAVLAPSALGLNHPSTNGDGGSGQATASPTRAPVVAGDRIGSIPSLVGDPASDPSVKERLAQYRAAWALFASSPIVGVGPGHTINWVNVSGGQVSEYTADTPLVLLAKFGLLGVIAFIGVAVAYGLMLRRASRAGWTVGSMALLGLGVLTLVSLPLGFPVEDKGFSLALILLIALVLVDTAEPVEGGASPAPRPGS